jgi:hypothetical protein
MALANEHAHDVDAEYLFPADARVVDLYELEDDLRVTVAVPCPECDETLALDGSVETVVEESLEVPLEEADDLYD